MGLEEKAVADMVERVPLAIRDKGLTIPINYDAYNAWLRSQPDLHRKYLEYLEAQ